MGILLSNINHKGPHLGHLTRTSISPGPRVSPTPLLLLWSSFPSHCGDRSRTAHVICRSGNCTSIAARVRIVRSGTASGHDEHGPTAADTAATSPRFTGTTYPRHRPPVGVPGPAVRVGNHTPMPPNRTQFRCHRSPPPVRPRATIEPNWSAVASE